MTEVEELTGFPECLDGRVKTLHPQGARRDPRRPPQPRPRAAARRARHRAVRPGRRQPLPVPRDGRLGRRAGRVRRADRHRRPVDGARRREEPRERRHRHRPGASTPRCWRPSAAAASPSTSASGWPPRRSCTPRPTTCAVAVVDGQRARRHAPTAPASRRGPARRGTAPRCCATARTRTSARRSTGTGAAGHRASAEQLHGKEMSYNNYVDADAAVRAASRPRRAGRRDHQARQPVRHRRRRRHRGGPPQGARLRPGVGLRRHHRDEPAGDRASWPSRWPRSSPR